MPQIDDHARATALADAASKAGMQVEAVVFIGSDRPQRSALFLQSITLAAVRSLAHSGGQLKKQQLAAPWLLTTSVITASHDTFPLEILELASIGRVLVGDLSIKADNLQAEHLRLQIERELRGTAIQLRQQVLHALDNRRQLADTLVQARIALARVVRGMIHLQDPTAAARPETWTQAAADDSTKNLIAAIRSDASNAAAYDALYEAVTAAAQAIDSHA